MYKIFLLLAFSLTFAQFSIAQNPPLVESFLQSKIQDINGILVKDYCKKNEGKIKSNNFYHQYSDYPFLSESIGSFSINFKGNICLQKDYKKIISVLSIAYKKGYNLSRGCADYDLEGQDNLKKIKKIILDLRDLEANFGNKDDKYFWDENYYGEKSKNCDEDWWKTLDGKWNELKDKINNTISGESFNLDMKINVDKARKKGEERARLWILETVDNYVGSFGFRSYFKGTNTSSIEDGINDNIKKDRNKINTKKLSENPIIPGKDTVEVLNNIRNDQKEDNIIDINSEIIYGYDLNNYLKESTNDFIENELGKLEASIIRSDGTKADLEKVNKNGLINGKGFDINLIDSLRKFIELTGKKLKQHNINEGRWPNFECGRDKNGCDGYNF